MDLGGFYLDILKDRLYTTPAAGHARRSAQTAMYHIAESMVRWLAPILSFTAEEIWRYLPGARAESVFLETWHTVPGGRRQPTSTGRRCMQLRGDVTRELERLRDAGAIGAPLDAEVDVYCVAGRVRALQRAGRRAALLLHHLAGARASIEGAPPADAALATNTGRTGSGLR